MYSTIVEYPGAPFEIFNILIKPIKDLLPLDFSNIVKSTCKCFLPVWVKRRDVQLGWMYGGLKL